MTTSQQPATVTDTVAYEEAPVSRFHLWITFCGTGGQFSDGFILGIIGIVIASATDVLGLTALWDGLLGAASLLGLFVGAVVMGPIADRVGRRQVFAWDMLVFVVLSAAQFFVQNATELLILRLLLGLVLGADYAIGKSLITEHAPRHFRGRLLSILAIAWAAGYAFAYLIGFLLSGLGDDSWRYMLAVSAVPALLIFGFRITVPESPLWLTRHGRHAEAAAIVRRYLGPGVRPPEAVPASLHRDVRALFDRTHRRRTAVACLFYVCQVIPYFALGTFVPQIMKLLGVKSALGSGALYNVLLLAGALAGLLVVDRISRRFFLISTFLGGAALLAALALFSGLSPILALVLFTTFAFVISAAANLEYVYPPELFPTDLRASGVGVAVAASRIGSAGSTFLLPIVADSLGMNAVFIGCVVVLLIGAVICWAWAPETSAESLTDIDSLTSQAR